jgi:hypothetical protein
MTLSTSAASFSRSLASLVVGSQIIKLHSMITVLYPLATYYTMRFVSEPVGATSENPHWSYHKMQNMKDPPYGHLKSEDKSMTENVRVVSVSAICKCPIRFNTSHALMGIAIRTTPRVF